MNKMNWFFDKIIFGIVSRQEIEKIIRNPNVDLSSINLISILDPDGIGKNGKPISNYFLKKFNSYIILKFWDTDGTLKEYPSINDKQALKLAKFIWNHRNEKFLIHCNAGISRSAGVGLAIECIIRFSGNKFEFQISKCKIKEHPRYYPNLHIFYKICEMFDRISFEGG